MSIREKYNGGILALDLATTTGWAFGRPDGPFEYGSVRFGRPGDERAVCYRAFRNWLEKVWNVRDAQPDLIVFESAAITNAMGGKTSIETIKKLVGLTEHLEEWCYGKFELREANVSQIRGHFIGQTRLKSVQAKAATVSKCRELGFDPKDDNAADALALLHYQIACLRPDIAVTSTPLFQRLK